MSKLKDAKPKILLCPLHTVLTSQYGSELSWSYYLYKYLLNVANVEAVVGSVNDKECLPANMKNHLHITGNGKIHYSPAEAAFFIMSYSNLGAKILLKEKFDILHHVLPFAHKKTFNLLGLRNKNLPLVIGPLQVPLSFQGVEFEPPLWQSALLDIFAKCLSYYSKKTLRKAKSLVVINRAAEKLFEKEVSKKTKIFLIPPGIEANRYQLHPRDLTEIRIAVIGGLIERKQVNVVLDAVNIIKNKGFKVKLYIAGGGGMEESLKKLAEELGLNNNISWLGRVPNDKIPNVLEGVDFLVSASKAESFGQVFLEAFASGALVITTPTEGAKEIVHDSVNGFFFPFGDSVTLANKIISLSRKNSKFIEITHKARFEVESTYNWKIIAEKYLEVYRSVL